MTSWLHSNLYILCQQSWVIAEVDVVNRYNRNKMRVGTSNRHTCAFTWRSSRTIECRSPSNSSSRVTMQVFVTDGRVFARTYRSLRRWSRDGGNDRVTRFLTYVVRLCRSRRRETEERRRADRSPLQDSRFFNEVSDNNRPRFLRKRLISIGCSLRIEKEYKCNCNEYARYMYLSVHDRVVNMIDG